MLRKIYELFILLRCLFQLKLIHLKIDMMLKASQRRRILNQRIGLMGDDYRKTLEFQLLNFQEKSYLLFIAILKTLL